ncbi:MAG: hypothetical protein Q8R15_04575, partial [Candidatus Micrarchaeota archaeon]|nr:hypothetical protein [Candidatus Micrarchaeota archaeon]
VMPTMTTEPRTPWHRKASFEFGLPKRHDYKFPEARQVYSSSTYKKDKKISAGFFEKVQDVQAGQLIEGSHPSVAVVKLSLPKSSHRISIYRNGHITIGIEDESKLNVRWLHRMIPAVKLAHALLVKHAKK